MAKKADKKSVTCEIKKIHLFLNDEKTKVYVRVSWNGNPPKDEVRSCWEKDGQLMLGKGISLSPTEITSLYDFLDTVGVDYEEPSKRDEPVGVDFDQLFETSVGIMEKRQQGMQTSDGFVVLTRKGGKRSDA